MLNVQGKSSGTVALDPQTRGAVSNEGAFVETAFTNNQVAAAIAEEAAHGGQHGGCAFLAGRSTLGPVATSGHLKNLENSMDIQSVKSEMTTLLKVFQCAILDVTAKVQEGALSPGDVADANVVVGMATVSSANLEAWMVQGSEFLEQKADLVHQTLRDFRRFADKLQADGFGCVT